MPRQGSPDELLRGRHEGAAATGARPEPSSTARGNLIVETLTAWRARVPTDDGHIVTTGMKLVAVGVTMMLFAALAGTRS